MLQQKNENVKELKVLQIITGLRPGGAERLLLNMCKVLKSSDKVKVIVASIAPESQLLSAFREEGIEVYRVNKKRNILELLKAFQRLWVIVKQQNVKVIHAHMFHSLVYACLIKLVVPSVKLVFTPHNISFAGIDKKEKDNFSGKIRSLIIRFTKRFRAADIIFSPRMKNKLTAKNSVIIPNGIDTKDFLSYQEKNMEFTFLCVGRLDYVKNQSFLVDIYSKHRHQLGKCKLLLVGTGVTENELKEKVKALGLQNQILFAGYQQDTKLFYQQTHVFLMPSLWEGMPLSLLEAGAAGLPIITTPVGTIPDMANENEVNFSELDTFAATMLDVKRNYQTALEKARRYQNKVVSEFDISITSKKHEDLYLTL